MKNKTKTRMYHVFTSTSMGLGMQPVKATSASFARKKFKRRFKNKPVHSVNWVRVPSLIDNITAI